MNPLEGEASLPGQGRRGGGAATQGFHVRPHTHTANSTDPHFCPTGLRGLWVTGWNKTCIFFSLLESKYYLGRRKEPVF